MLLGGRVLRFSYVSLATGQPIAGELTIAYEKGADSSGCPGSTAFHTSASILSSESKRVSEGATDSISAFGTYYAGEGEPRWGWRTELDDGSADEALHIRMFNVMPGGEETIGVEIDLKREETR